MAQKRELAVHSVDETLLQSFFSLKPSDKVLILPRMPHGVVQNAIVCMILRIMLHCTLIETRGLSAMAELLVFKRPNEYVMNRPIA